MGPPQRSRGPRLKLQGRAGCLGHTRDPEGPQRSRRPSPSCSLQPKGCKREEAGRMHLHQNGWEGHIEKSGQIHIHPPHPPKADFLSVPEVS